MGLLPELFAKAIDTDGLHVDILLAASSGAKERADYAKFDESKHPRDVQVVMEALKYSFDEGKHPRVGKGSSEGGQFGEGGGKSATEERPTKAAQPQAAKQTDTPEFKRWFGESKVVDESGAPLVVYHGTPTKQAGFNRFDSRKIGSTTDAGFAGTGFYTSSDPSVAAAYGSVLMPVYLKADKIFSFDGLNFHKEVKAKGGPEKFSQWLRDNGYQGAQLWSQYMVLDPTQIKSATGNRGTFDPENPDIRFGK